MGTKRKCFSDEDGCKEMKHDDLVKFSNIFASEFNNSSMYDRVLVFQVIEEGCQHGEVSETGPPNNEEPRNCGTNGKETDPNDVIKEINQEPVLVENENEKDGKKEEQRETKKDVYLEEEWKEEKEVEVVEKEDEEEKKEEGVQSGEEEMEVKEVAVEEREDGSKKEEDIGTEIQTDGSGSNTFSDNPMSRSQTKQRKIHVHSSWLAVQSPYFKALFYSGMKESHCKEVVMRITSNELQGHATLIEAMYRLDVLDDKDFELVLEVLALADKYDVDLVLKKCKYMLMSMSLTLKKCEQILKVVKDRAEFTELLGSLEKFLVKEFRPLDWTWTMDKFSQLSEASLRMLLSSNDLAVECENTVFVGLMEWIKCNAESLALSQSSLLSLVRFEFMTADFLYDIVQYHDTAQKMANFDKLLKKGLGFHGFSRARREQPEIKPVPRNPYEEAGYPFPTLSWIIDSKVRKKLRDTSVVCREFWFWGYKMKLELHKPPDTSYYEFFLYVDLKEGSFLNVSWFAESDLFDKSLYSNKPMENMYSSEVSGCGDLPEISDAKLYGVSDDVSYTIDVWVSLI